MHLHDGQDALIVSADCAQAWAEAIDRLVADPHLRARLGAAAKEKLERQYTWSRRAKEIVHLF